MTRTVQRIHHYQTRRMNVIAAVAIVATAAAAIAVVSINPARAANIAAEADTRAADTADINPAAIVAAKKRDTVHLTHLMDHYHHHHLKTRKRQ